MCLWRHHNSLKSTSLSSSYDSREMTDLRPDRPDLWSEPSAFGDRAHFRVSTQPAVLSVTGVQRFDAGTYTCRVDFRQSPTVYHHVKLDIIGEYFQWIRSNIRHHVESFFRSRLRGGLAVMEAGKIWNNDQFNSAKDDTTTKSTLVSKSLQYVCT